MPLIYYWRRNNYLRDLPQIAGDGLRLQQNSAAFRSLKPGERVWAITRAGDGKYALAAQVRVGRIIEEPTGTYGRFSMEPEPSSAILYDVESGPDIESLVRSLSIDPGARVLGHSFQGPAAARRITEADDARLAEFAGALVGNSAGDQGADVDEPNIPPRQELRTTRIVRDTRVARQLKILYNDTCQLCGLRLQDEFGWSYSEAHHVRPLGGAHRGPDEPSNILILCPNHHALCDFGAIRLEMQMLRVRADHGLSVEALDYHNRHIVRRGLHAV